MIYVKNSISKEQYLSMHEELLCTMQNHAFWIFGCGKVAEQFYDVVNAIYCVKNLKGFVESEKTRNEFRDKKVVTLDFVQKDEWILVAASETYTVEIRNYITRRGYKKCIEVYWHLRDFQYGLPIRYNVQLDTRQLFFENTNFNCISIYYLGIGYCFGENDFGKSLYIKGKMRGRKGLETFAIKDWERFQERIIECNREGFVQDYNIKVNQDATIILDGSHRIALAQYFHISKLMGDLYDCSLSKHKEILGIRENEAYWYDDALVRKWCTENEFELIKGVLSKSRETIDG